MAHGCGSRKDDWLAEEEELEAKEEAEMGTASEERSRAVGVEALVERRGETCATRKGGGGGTDRSLVASQCGKESARVDRAGRLDGRNGGKTDGTSGRCGRIEAASGWRSTKVKPTKVGEESVIA